MTMNHKKKITREPEEKGLEGAAKQKRKVVKSYAVALNKLKIMYMESLNGKLTTHLMTGKMA